MKPSEKPRLIKAVQKWMLEMCDDPNSCGHDYVSGTKDGLGVCDECGDRGVFNLSAGDIAAYIARAKGAKRP